MGTDGNSIGIDSGRATFALADGRQFQADLLDLSFTLDDLLRQAVDGGKSQREHLQAVAATVQADYGLTLGLGETQDLCDQVSLLVAKKNALRSRAFAALAPSPASTPESTPSA
jgi:hypothetical protein